jgi:hypothetical protein
VLRICALPAKCRTCYLFLLLISATVQGLTPAQQNLASSWGLLHFFSIQDFSDSADDDSDAQEEECVSTLPDRRPDLRLLAESVERVTILSPRRIELAFLRFCILGDDRSSDQLSIVLCRLVC